MLVMFALFYSRSMAVPIATAFAMYMVLRPIVRQGSRWGIPSTVGAAGILIGLLVALGLGTYLVIDPAQEIIADAPQHIATLKQKLSTVTAKLHEVNEATEDLASTASNGEAGQAIAEEEEPVPVEIKQPGWINGISYLSGTGNVVSFLTITGALLYFLLATGDRLLRSVMQALPTFTARRKLVEVIRNVQEGFGDYLAKISAINMCLGIAVAMAMWFWEMPSPIMWGVMAFAFNYLPIVGAIVGCCIIFLVALMNFEPTYYAFLVAGTFLTLTSLEGQFITPAILGRSMRINPVLVFLSIVVWGWMWGIMGVFLSVPILIATRFACEAYDGLAPLGLILGAEIREPKQDEKSTTSSTVPLPHVETSLAIPSTQQARS